MDKKILILDDDDDILEILSLLLTDNGYETQTLSRGELVFDAIREFHPDLLLMDVMLAGIDGRVICKHIKHTEETNRLPIILISGTHDLASSLQENGAPNDFVAKPFDMDYLMQKIKNQLCE